MQHETGFQSSADGNVAMHHRSQWDGFRLQSEKGKYICQWKRDCLVFSRLQPYDTWPKLLDAAMPFWSAYRKIGAPAIIEGISVRFISQIPLKENEKPSKYVQKVHPPLNGLGLRADAFFHQVKKIKWRSPRCLQRQSKASGNLRPRNRRYHPSRRVRDARRLHT